MKKAGTLFIALLSISMFTSPLLSSDLKKSDEKCPYLQSIHEKKPDSACPYSKELKKHSFKKNENEIKCPYSGKSLKRHEVKQKVSKQRIT